MRTDRAVDVVVGAVSAVVVTPLILLPVFRLVRAVAAARSGPAQYEQADHPFLAMPLCA